MWMSDRMNKRMRKFRNKSKAGMSCLIPINLKLIHNLKQSQMSVFCSQEVYQVCKHLFTKCLWSAFKISEVYYFLLVGWL